MANSKTMRALLDHALLAEDAILIHGPASLAPETLEALRSRIDRATFLDLVVSEPSGESGMRRALGGALGSPSKTVVVLTKEKPPEALATVLSEAFHGQLAVGPGVTKAIPDGTKFIVLAPSPDASLAHLFALRLDASRLLDPVPQGTTSF